MLSQRDLHLVLSRIPRDVVKLMRDDSGIIMAGGIIRAIIGNEEAADIDLFGPSVEALNKAAGVLEAGRLRNGEGARVHKTKNAITLLTMGRMPIQFITRWVYTDAASVAKDFDFTVCMAAIKWDTASEQFISATGDSFYQDLAAKRLVYTAPARDEDAGGSMLRVIKYIKRGYNIQPDSLAAVASRFYNCLWKFDDHHKDEAQRTIMLQAALREVDPLLVIDGVELGDEHGHMNTPQADA